MTSFCFFQLYTIVFHFPPSYGRETMVSMHGREWKNILKTLAVVNTYFCLYHLIKGTSCVGTAGRTNRSIQITLLLQEKNQILEKFLVTGLYRVYKHSSTELLACCLQIYFKIYNWILSSLCCAWKHTILNILGSSQWQHRMRISTSL
jgi:hypothetical protein